MEQILNIECVFISENLYNMFLYVTLLCFVLRDGKMFIGVLLVSRLLNNRPQYINTPGYILSLCTLKVLFVCLPVCLSSCLFVFLSVCLSVSLSVFITNCCFFLNIYFSHLNKVAYLFTRKCIKFRIL